MNEAQAKDYLVAAYRAEVEFRHRKFVLDAHTSDNIGQLARFLTDGGSRFGVMFFGLCGNGKTTLVYALQNAINYLERIGAVPSKTGITIIDAKEVVRRSKDDNEFRRMLDSDMIAIEDMGREPRDVLEYGNVLNPVIDLLEYRYNRQLFTIVTTNLKPQQVREHYGDRIADRCNEMFDRIVFQNESYRRVTSY